MFDLDYYKTLKNDNLNKERLSKAKSMLFNRQLRADLKLDIHRLNNHNLTNLLISKFNPDFNSDVLLNISGLNKLYPNLSKVLMKKRLNDM